MVSLSTMVSMVGPFWLILPGNSFDLSPSLHSLFVCCPIRWEGYLALCFFLELLEQHEAPIVGLQKINKIKEGLGGENKEKKKKRRRRRDWGPEWK